MSTATFPSLIATPGRSLARVAAALGRGLRHIADVITEARTLRQQMARRYPHLDL